MAAMRIPGTLFVIWFVSPWPMKPAPSMPTWIGRPATSRSFSALSTMIMMSSLWRARSRAHPGLQFCFDVVEEWPGSILRRELGHGQRPLEPEARIVVAQAALGVRGVELTDLVARFGGVLEDLVTVGEALRHVDGPVIVGGQLDRHVPQVGRAVWAEVDDDVDDRPARAAHELRLGSGRVLEMHPAHRAPTDVEREVGLGDRHLEAVISELLLAKGTGKESPVVLASLEFDHERSGERRLLEDHDCSLRRATATPSTSRPTLGALVVIPTWVQRRVRSLPRLLRTGRRNRSRSAATQPVIPVHRSPRCLRSRRARQPVLPSPRIGRPPGCSAEPCTH